MRCVWLVVCVVCGYLNAAESVVDVEQTMKTMAFEYKKAYQSDNSSDMLPALQHLIDLTKQAQQADFAPEKNKQYQQGLQQVLTQLQLARAAALQHDMVAAKHHLQQVDALRKDYHKLRKVSIWDLLFG